MKLKTLKRKYLCEAALMLVVAQFAVRFVAAARIFAWADRPLRRVNRFAVGEVSWIAWAVETISGNQRMNVLCLPRALALHAMMRRRGIASRLCLGVAHDKEKLVAHAWVEIGDTAVALDPAVARFARLAEFGATPV